MASLSQDSWHKRMRLGSQTPHYVRGGSQKNYFAIPSDIVGGLATQTQPLVPGSLTYTCHIKVYDYMNVCGKYSLGFLAQEDEFG